MQVQEGGDAYTRAFVDVLVGVGKVASPSSSSPPEKVLKQILREVQVLVSSAHDQPRTVEEYARMRPMFETYRKVTNHIAKNWEQSDMDLDTVRQLLSTLTQQLPQLFPRLEYSDELPAIQDQHYATSDEMQNWEVIGMLAKKIDDHFMFILNPVPLSPGH
ncbi:hypothetical protein CPB86DRAFT_71415 [Serendipita vermifera]|nr:hypothetical protein CPB86DRAFT_71415 [Serendipita vermifera]